MTGPLALYVLLAAMVAAYGSRRLHGFWRLLALGVAFTPILLFVYLLVLERAMDERA